MSAFSVPEEPRGEVVQLRKDQPLPEPPSRARELLLSAIRPLPTRRHLAASAWWWTKHLAQVLPSLHILGWRELRPTLRGLGALLHGWATWASARDKHEYAKLAEGNTGAKLGTAATKTTSARRWISLVLFAAWSGVWVWAWLVYPMGAIAASALCVAGLDLYGRSLRPGEAPIVHLPTGPIVDGIPLSSLRAEIQASFEGQGFEVTVAMPVVTEHGWTVAYHTRAAVEDEHMRQLERDLNMRRKGITQIVLPGQAARGTLHIALRDPLAAVVPSPELDDLTLHGPLPLGVTASGDVWEEQFLRTHFALVGASQSGKSSCLWQITDVLRRCPEIELDAIDLTEGPAFGASRRAFRKRAFDEEGAHRILDDAIALCERRNAELKRRAEDDDTPDDYEEKWHPTKAEPQRTVLIDEFARIAATKDEVSKEVPFGATLIGKVEYLLRYGAKAAVTVGVAGQGGTLDDFGTSTVRAQAMLKIMFACARADVLWLFGKDARDTGYRPDLLEPANGPDLRDAGKSFVMSAMSKTPEPRRAYRLDQHEVRRRDRALGSRERVQPNTVDAVEVPAALAAVEAAFRDAGNPDRMATAELLQWLQDAGMDLDASQLAEQLRPIRLRPADKRWSPTPGANPVRGYLLADVRAAIRDLP